MRPIDARRLIAALTIVCCGMGPCTAALAAGAAGPESNRLKRLKPANIQPPMVLPDSCELGPLVEEGAQAVSGDFSAQFTVEADSVVSAVQVLKKTGSERLDDLSLSALRTCRFSPGSEEGKPTRTTALLEVQWRPGTAARVYAKRLYTP